MGLYQEVRKVWKAPRANLGKLFQARMTAWTRGLATMRIERPTRIDRARSLGYRAKPGVIVVRQRVGRSARMRSKLLRSGRRPKHNRLMKVVDKNYQHIAEERVARKYPNCEVVNSYAVGETGKHHFFEVILIDREHPAVKKDPVYSKLAKSRGRAFRGLTSAATKHRGGMRKKSAEKGGPSVRNKRRGSKANGTK